MNDEIKEINIKIPGQILDYVDTKDHLLDLFNYITNLQQELEIMVKDDERNQETIIRLTKENEKLKKALNCKEYFSSTMPEDIEFVLLTKNNYDRQQKDIQFELIDYKSRCEKAIEYIEEYQEVLKEHNGDWINYQDGFKPYLLNILQNGSEKDG